jgi:hypothetical protein
MFNKLIEILIFKSAFLDLWIDGMLEIDFSDLAKNWHKCALIYVLHYE